MIRRPLAAALLLAAAAAPAQTQTSTQAQAPPDDRRELDDLPACHADGTDAIGADSARIKGHLQAWHVRKDGATVPGLGSWQVEAAHRGRLAHRRRTPDSPLRVVIPKSE